MSAPTGRFLLVIFGAGSHGREVAWLAGEALPEADLVFAVDDARFASGPVNGIPVRVLSELDLPDGSRFVTAVGDPGLRRRAVDTLTAQGLTPIALVHPRAIVAPGAVIGEGAVVAAGSVLSDHVRVGAHAIVNIGCTVSHDVDLGPFTTLSPGVHIAGHVAVGDGAVVGVGANIINGTAEHPLMIGAGATVGAGAVVIGDVDPSTTVAGVPARPIHSRDAR